MLTVAKITTGSAAGYADYLEGRSQPSALGDYYLRDGDRVEAPGRWANGAKAVGIDPTAMEVSGEQLRTLMAVRRPDTGEPLRRAGATGQVAALDATFSAPKSVSAVWAIGGPELRGKLERAHEHAIDQTLHYSVGRVAMIRVRTPAGVVHSRARDVIATSWRHTTARAVPGRAPDPQLHSHVLLHGAVRADERIVAIDSRRWLQHGRELGAAYRTELARELSQLGFEIARGTGRGGRYFEIAGVPQELIDRWSGRHHQVRAAIDAQLGAQQRHLESRIRGGGRDGEHAAESLRRLRENPRLTPAQDRRAAVTTRSAKQPPSTHRDLDQAWEATARDHGLSLTRFHRLRRLPFSELAPGGDLLDRLTEFDARFTAREARAVALEASAGLAIDKAIAPLGQLRRDGSLLELSDATLTTGRHRAAERATLSAVDGLAGARAQPIEEALARMEIDRLSRRLSEHGGQGLTSEQADAIRLMCADRQLALIEGQAGTGKSTVLAAAARAHQTGGQRIIVTSTAALAAHRLAEDLRVDGVDCQAYSTAALHAAITTGRERLDPRTTIIHDEAALASTREQHHLFTAVQDTGARLIEVGDPAQSQPVGAAGLWPDIQTAARRDRSHQSLTRNLRALDGNDRRDQRRFRDGDHLLSIQGYHDRGRVHIATETSEAEDHALAAAQTDRRSGKDVLKIAQTSNDHLDELNARAQALRHQDGELTGPGIPVPGRPYALHAGDNVQVRRTLLAPGPPQAIPNGSTGHISRVERDPEQVLLVLDTGPEVTLNRAELAAGDVRLAYVQHPFPAQGLTSDTAHLIHTDQATREGSYVALTRARERTTIHTPRLSDDHALSGDETREDTLAALAERMGRSQPDVPSIHLPLAHETDISHDVNSATHPTTRGTSTANDPEQRVTQALGPRPAEDDPRRVTWDAGADQITGYRERYGIPEDDPRPLGPEPPIGCFTQRDEHRRVTATLDDAARSLGHTAPGADLERHRASERTREGEGFEP